MSRLHGSTSTYLAQHADNPVDWWPWGDEAFAEARRRDVPVLLSVGYAACHWCHVMARESFSDPATAEQLNRDFVSIKVDREERPDVDAVYMTATQALTGQGGWPMTVFLTPDAQPFYAGTYYPPVPTGGMPSFRQLLTALAEAWRGDRDRVLTSAAHIGSSLAEMSAPLAARPLAAADLDRAAEELVDQFDPVHGGFRGAPKFPPTMVAEFLLRHAERTGSAAALDAVGRTLEGMARGGIYDQLGGGFARYSVDAVWHVPHFEKMLDDNAQLLAVYTHHARLTSSALSARIAAEIAEFLLRDMRLPTGAFAVALDADTAGVEGLTYLWTLEDLGGVLGPLDGERAAAVFALPGSLTATGGSATAAGPAGDPLADRVLRLPADPDDPAWFADARRRLLEARNRRPQPARDDLVVLRSNGLAIAGLADAGASFGRLDWVAAAASAADYLVRVHRDGQHWARSSRDGRVGPGPAVLADHGDLARGLLALFQATGDARWLLEATAVVDVAVELFADGSGGFVDTSRAGGDLLVRPRDPTDGAAPSGLSSITHALLGVAALTGEPEYRRAADAAAASVGSLVERFPRSAGWHLAAAEAALSGPLQIAIVGSPGSDRQALVDAARAHAPAGSVFDVGAPDEPGHPLLAERPLLGGRAAAYVCRGFVCDRPVSDAASLRGLLSRKVLSGESLAPS